MCRRFKLAGVLVTKTIPLELFQQTKKELYGLLSWYTSAKYGPEEALRVKVIGVGPGGGGLLSIHEAMTSIASEKQIYQPTSVTLTAITTESWWDALGVADSEIIARVYNTARIQLGALNVNSGQRSYLGSRADLSIDVTAQSQFIIEVSQEAFAIGWNDIRTRYITLEFVFETTVNVQPFTLRCVDEKGLLIYDTRAYINGMSYELPGGELDIALPSGTYAIEAYATVGGKKYYGKKEFTLPANLVEVTLKPESALPSWWWIPVVAVGGIAVMAVVIPLVRKRETIVVR